jgi:hypothetical protein
MIPSRGILQQQQQLLSNWHEQRFACIHSDESKKKRVYDIAVQHIAMDRVLNMSLLRQSLHSHVLELAQN